VLTTSLSILKIIPCESVSVIESSNFLDETGSTLVETEKAVFIPDTIEFGLAEVIPEGKGINMAFRVGTLCENEDKEQSKKVQIIIVIFFNRFNCGLNFAKNI